MFDELKKELGIDSANCLSCTHKGTDDSGEDAPAAYVWDVCEKEGIEHYSNLKSFPFKKNMKCWCPEFWHSSIADQIKGDDEKDKKVFDSFFQILNKYNQ